MVVLKVVWKAVYLANLQVELLDFYWVGVSVGLSVALLDALMVEWLVIVSDG